MLYFLSRWTGGATSISDGIIVNRIVNNLPNIWRTANTHILILLNEIFHQANYVLCMGTLMSAIVMWQNSLVFHSLDKLTSFFLHFFPPLHLHLFRWQHTNFFVVVKSTLNPTKLLLSWGLIPCPAIKKEDFLDLREGLLLPMLLYAIWQVHFQNPFLLFCQVVYLVITEGLLHKAMEEDPALVTSMRWHFAPLPPPGIWLRTRRTRCIRWQRRRAAPWASSQGKTHTYNLAKLCFFREESFDSRTMKTKIIFVVTQIFYTMLTLLPTPLFFGSYSLR